MENQFLLDNNVIFLNHGSFGAVPQPVFEKYQFWQRELERQPVAFLARESERLIRNARKSLANFIGCHRDEIVFIPNTTTGLNIIARSLSLNPGDEVLTTDQEYGAMARMWHMICDSQKAICRETHIPLPIKSKEEIVSVFRKAISEKTRFLFCSHITSSSALIMPVKELTELAYEHGIKIIIDGAHAPGQIDLDLHNLNPDFYVGNCHKWLMAPKGSAFLHVPLRNQPMIKPLIISWGRTNRDKHVSPFLDELEYQGTTDIAAYLAVPEAIMFIQKNNWPTIRHRSFEMLLQFRDDISGKLPLLPLSPPSEEWFQQMAAWELPPDFPPDLQQRLLESHSIEIPVTRTGDRFFLRLSIQSYNRKSDLTHLVSALEQEISAD